jgi:hypothetical protein
MRQRHVELDRTVLFKVSNNNIIYLNLTQPNSCQNLCQLTRTCATYETEQLHEEAHAQDDPEVGASAETTLFPTQTFRYQRVLRRISFRVQRRTRNQEIRKLTLTPTPAFVMLEQG